MGKEYGWQSQSQGHFVFSAELDGMNGGAKSRTIYLDDTHTLCKTEQIHVLTRLPTLITSMILHASKASKDMDNPLNLADA